MINCFKFVHLEDRDPFPNRTKGPGAHSLQDLVLQCGPDTLMPRESNVVLLRPRSAENPQDHT